MKDICLGYVLSPYDVFKISNKGPPYTGTFNHPLPFTPHLSSVDHAAIALIESTVK